jgi:hypothetical protein
LELKKATVLITYAPTNTLEQSVVKEFYRDLGSTLQDIPVHNFVTILWIF